MKRRLWSHVIQPTKRSGTSSPISLFFKHQGIYTEIEKIMSPKALCIIALKKSKEMPRGETGRNKKFLLNILNSVKQMT